MDVASATVALTFIATVSVPDNALAITADMIGFRSRTTSSHGRKHFGKEGTMSTTDIISTSSTCVVQVSGVGMCGQASTERCSGCGQAAAQKVFGGVWRCPCCAICFCYCALWMRLSRICVVSIIIVIIIIVITIIIIIIIMISSEANPSSSGLPWSV